MARIYGGQNSRAGKSDGAMKKGRWIAGATANKGGLHRSLGVKEGQKIPPYLIREAARQKGKVGKQARLAETLEGLRK